MKISLTRVLETAKILSTEVGQSIPDFFQYMAEFVEQTVRSLRNGLNFRDNFDCEFKTVSLLHDTPQTIQATRQVSEIRFVRLMSQSAMLTAWAWYYDDAGRLTIKIKFDSDPGEAIDVIINLIF